MRTPFLTLCIILALGAAIAFAQPISSFETEESMKLFTAGGTTVERVQQHAADGEWSLKVFFPGNEKDTWPGLYFKPDVDTTQYQTLAFDVFNEGKDHAALSWRIDFKEGDPVFSGQGVAPGGPHRIEIWLSGMGPITRVFPYIRMPRKDNTLYFDNFMWATVKNRFKPLVYVDDATPPEPTADETARGFIPFRRALTDVVFANSIPLPEQRAQTIDLFATPGEYEAATLSVYALEDLAQVKVSFDGIPATGEVLPVRALNKRVTYSSTQYIQDMPVLCERREAVDVAKGTSKRFVLELKIDENAEAKVYEGQVHIDRAGGERVSLPLRLRVLPFKLSEPGDMLWGEYYQGPRLATTDEEKFVTMRRDMTDMRAHGMTSVGLCFGISLDQVQWQEDGTCAIEFDGSSLYEELMKLYVEFGYPAPVILLSDSGQAAAGKDFEGAVDGDEWGERYKTFWKAMQAEHARLGWPEVIVQPVDEPGWQGQQQKDRNERCLKLLKQIPGMRTEQDGPGDAYFHGTAGPYSDVWNYNGSISKPEVYKKAQAEGRIITLYNCDVESYRPEVDRYTAGWFQAAGGISGCYNWAYISYNGSPYDDLDHKTGTWMHVYPPMKDEPGGPSTGWIGAREGIDDYKYIHTLREAIARGEAGNDAAKRAATAGRKVLDDLIAGIDWSPSVRSRAKWTQRGAKPDGTKTIGGTLKLPNGWQHDEYEKARWRVARATLDIMTALREVPSSVKGRRDSSDFGPLVASTRWSTEVVAAAPELGGKNARQVTIPVLGESPVIDGDLSDTIWAEAVTLDAFGMASGTGKPEMQTEVRVGSDGANLFLGVTCHEEKMDYLTARITDEGGAVWQDDCVEVFVDNNLDQSTFRQVLVNALGVQGWNDSTDSKWRAASVAAAKRLDDRWTVELSIPMADLGLTGNQFGFNVCRERRPMETMELSCWSPTGGAFGQPDRFGLASLGQAWIGGISVPPASIGVNSFTVTLKNETDKWVGPVATLGLKWPEKGSLRILDQEISIQPGEEVKRTYEYELPTPDAPTMTFSLLWPKDQNPPPVLAERTFAPSVLNPLTMAVRPRTYYLSETLGAADFKLDLAPSAREKTRLILALYNADETAILRQFDISPLEGNRLTAMLNLRGLPEGSYRLWAVLDDAEGTRISERSARIERFRGTFD